MNEWNELSSHNRCGAIIEDNEVRVTPISTCLNIRVRLSPRENGASADLCRHTHTTTPDAHFHGELAP
jgi:hypothetical protein